jgi:hypothetical protein
MTQESYSYLFLLIILFAAGGYAYRLVQVRVKRDSLLQKYKPGSVGYGVVQNSLQPWRLVLTVVVLLLSVALLAVDVYAHRHPRDFFFILAFSLVIIIVAFALAPIILKGTSGQRGKQ